MSEASVNGPRELPSSVHLIELADREIYLVGTAHVSQSSVADVRATLEIVEPETVCVELCEPRYLNLIDPERWKRVDILEILRAGKAPLLLSSLIMTSFQRRIADRLGVEPGAEMLAAIDGAKSRGAELVLADRSIEVTLRRTGARLGLWTKMKIFSSLLAGLFGGEEIDEEEVEKLKQEEHLADALQLLSREFPQAKETLIDERDTYLAQKIREAPGKKIVAVVGAGHVAGILSKIATDHPLQELICVPPPSRWFTLLKWAIPLAVVGLILYGFAAGDSTTSTESIVLWVVINGGLSALGTAIALGHPLTVLSAFVAAPLTSLNPMIAAGWVAGLVQVWLKRPRVSDLESLPQAITTVRGFWSNAVTRILLVVVLANLGSTLGTLIAFPWIAARVF